MQPLAEIVEAGVRLALPLLHYFIDKVAAHVFDSVEAEADLSVGVGSKAAIGDIDVRRQHFDAKASALARVLNDLIGVVQHAGEQGGHELAAVMALEVGCLECDVGVAGRVALVERIGRKAGHLVVNFVGHFFRDAVGYAARALVAGVGAAMDKMLPLGLHNGVLLLAHGAADVVCLPKGEACQLAEDLHDLLLIDDAPVGDVQNVGQLRRFVANFVRLVAVAQVGRDGVHGTGAVQADESDDVFEVLRLQTHEHLLHARRFQLEHALRLALGEHGIRLRVVVIELGDGEVRVLFLDGQLRVSDDRQGAQAQKIHLQQAQLLNLGHVELCHGQAVVGGQRQIVVGRFRGDDDARRMGGSVAGHSLHLHGRVDEFRHLRVVVVHLLEFRRNFQRAFQRHFQFHRHLFCHNIHALVGHSQHTAHIADGVAGGHGAKGDDLGHMVCAVLAVDVVDDLLPPLVAEIHVEIGHTDAFGVQKALENQVVADGVDVGDADAVGRDAACAGATARAHRHALTLGVVDVIPDDEVVVGIAHLLDDADLIVQAVFVSLRHVGAVAVLQTFPAEFLEKILIVHAAGGLVIGDLGVAELEIKIALVGDLLGVLAGFRHHGEQLVHFIRRFDVEFIGLELHAVGVLHGFARLDAEQDGLHLRVLFAQVVGIVGGYHGDARFPRQLDELRQNDVVFFEAVVLQFNIVIALAEEVAVPQGRALGPVIVARQKSLRYLARKAGGKADEALVVLFQELLIHAGLGVKALHEGGGHHLAEVFVARLVFAQQDQMVVAVDLIDFIKAGAGGNIDLTADDGLDARFLGRLVKLYAPVHHAVVGAGNGGLTALLHPVHQLVDAAGAVQQAILRMDVEVDKVSPLLVVFAGFGHAVSSLFLCSSSSRWRSASASASSFFMRWESPDLLMGGSKQAHSAVKDKSGASIRLAAASCSASGSVSSAFCSCKKRMAFSVWALARAVLPRLAVSQLVWRLIWLRTCFTAFCALICAAASVAPIKARMRSTWTLFLT